MGALLDEDWEYTARPDIVPRDAVRELVGDTDKNQKLMSDTTISLALNTQGGNERMAASRVAELIAARFMKEATTKSGKDYSRTMDRATAYTALSEKLKVNSPSNVGYAAQLRCSTGARLYGNADIRRGAFRTGMFYTSEFDPRTEVTDQDLLDDSRDIEEP